MITIIILTVAALAILGAVWVVCSDVIQYRDLQRRLRKEKERK